MISSISMVNLTVSAGILLLMTPTRVKVCTEPAVPKWTSGKPTVNQPKSLLIPVVLRVRPDALVKTAVTTIKIRGMTVFATRTVAITTPIDLERPTFTVQEVSTPWIPPRR
jgi:hypothetical protein